jgi:predicted rRNA methylase YqxC with S4 and FtsJ domains
MAKFISTTEISYHIEKIIKESKFFLVLISPYFKVHERLQKLLIKKSAYTSITIVYGKEELNKSEWYWIEKLKEKNIHFEKNLHGKIYLNEEYALITSMNLYEYSQVNNIEYGVLLNKNDDLESVLSDKSQE